MSDIRKVGRREFLKLSAGGGAGLWLAVNLPSRADAAEGAALAPDAYLRVEPSGTVTVFLAKSEMGQGTYTGMAVLVAEELEADWKKVKVVQADADAKSYGQMTTGGSRSVRQYFDPLRKTGATAREMLIAAAATRWGVDRSTCRAEAGSIVHVPSGRKLGYGALAAAAAREEVPKDPPLKEPKDWKLIGTKVPRLDTPDKTRGRARFGIDVRIPGLRFAAIARPPVVGGKVLRYDAAKAKAVPGVRSVVEVPSGVAVVADSTWAAFQGRDALGATFDPGPNGGLDSAALEKLLADMKAKGKAAKTPYQPLGNQVADWPESAGKLNRSEVWKAPLTRALTKKTKRIVTARTVMTMFQNPTTFLVTPSSSSISSSSLFFCSSVSSPWLACSPSVGFRFWSFPVSCFISCPTSFSPSRSMTYLHTCDA